MVSESEAPRTADVAAPAPVPAGMRRNDLDWIRIAAFGLLILYHVALVYAPYDWHIHSVHTFQWLHEGLLLTNPWRLTLLFLVSGAALRLMTLRRTAGQTLQARAERLIPPLLFGVLVLVPIQSWIEAMDKGSFGGNLLDWMLLEFSPEGQLDGIPINHLWFLVYIGVYSLVAIDLMSRPERMAWAERGLVDLLSGWRVIWVPILYLIVIRVVLFPMFGVTNRLTWDFYNHALSLAAFLFGFLVVRHEAVWQALERYRLASLALAIAVLPIMMLQSAHPGGGAFLSIPRNIVFAIDQWAVIAAILGYGSRYLRHANGPILRYLVDAVFTLYLVHQTVLVVATWFVRPAELPAAVEATVLVTATFGVSLLIYEVVRRFRPWRPIWGLKPLPGPADRPLHQRHRRMLQLGMAAPVLALAAVLVAVAAYPGFDHARQYLSELGGASARWPLIFNAGVFIAGLMCAVSGPGFGLAMVAVGGSRIAGALVALAFILAGIGLSLSSLFPWPDPRHMAINLGLGIQIAPLLMLAGLWQVTGMTRLKLFLGVTFVVMAVLTVITYHLVAPGTVHPGNVGLWERGYAIVLVGWVGIAAWCLDRRLQAATNHGSGMKKRNIFHSIS